jgi:hypothetical protein
MKPLMIMALTMMLSACSSPVTVLRAGSLAADPDVPVPPVRYVPVTAGAQVYQPVEPKPWAGQRGETTPPPEGSEGSEQKGDDRSKSDAENPPTKEAP